MLYLISVILFTLGLGAGLCWLFFVINKENQALNVSIDKLQAEVDTLFNQRKSPAHVGDEIKDGVNTKTYLGNNVWSTTLVHECDPATFTEITGGVPLHKFLEVENIGSVSPIDGADNIELVTGNGNISFGDLNRVKELLGQAPETEVENI